MALPADVTTGTWTLDNSHSEIGFTVISLTVSLLAIPALVLALVMLGIMGPSQIGILIVIVLLYTPIVARVVRSASAQQVRMPLPEPAQRALDDAVLGEVFGADRVLGRGDAEEDQSPEAEGSHPLGFAVERGIHREVVHPRHRADLPLDPGPVHHEDRLDEVGGGEVVLAHQPAHRCGTPPASGSFGHGGGHGGKTRERWRTPQPHWSRQEMEPGMRVAGFLRK